MIIAKRSFSTRCVLGEGAGMGEARRFGVVGRLWSRRYSAVGVRVGLGCAVLGGVCLSQLGGSGVTGADTAFVQGTAAASAQAIQLAPTTGGLNYAITLATSISQYQNAASAALSQTIDLGAIGTALEAKGCDGSPPKVPASAIPQPVQAESINGNQTLTSTVTPQSTTLGVGVGNELAQVTTQPTGSAITTVQNIAVPGGLITVSGLTSSSHVSIDNGDTRVAVATSDIGAISLAGGAIQIGGLHWIATQDTGAKSISTATFSIGSLKVGGATIPLTPTTSPTALLSVINTVGSQIGFNIQWPATSTLPDGTIQITPLTIGIDNNLLGQKVIGANLGTVQPLRQALVAALLKLNCNFAIPVLLGDIDIGVLSGGGNLNLNLGGAHALTSDAAPISPFGSGFGTSDLNLSLPSLPSGSGDGGIATLPSSGFSVPSSVGTSSLLPTTAAPGHGAGSSRQALGPLLKTTSCVTTSPAGGGCAATNVAVPIGFIALGLVFLLAVWDYFRQRRKAQLMSALEGNA
jgi:hypothetical protein